MRGDAADARAILGTLHAGEARVAQATTRRALCFVLNTNLLNTNLSLAAHDTHAMRLLTMTHNHARVRAPGRRQWAA